MASLEDLRDEDWLREQCESRTDQDIADMVGCTRINVRYWRHRHGIDRTVIQELRDPNWLLDALEDKTQEEVADELGCSQSYVSEWARRHR